MLDISRYSFTKPSISRLSSLQHRRLPLFRSIPLLTCHSRAILLGPLFKTLSLDLKERHKQQADKAQCHGKPKERSIRFVRIVCVIPSRCRFVGNTCKNRCADAESNCRRQLNGCLENGARDGLLRLRQRAHDVHLGRIELAIWQE